MTEVMLTSVKDDDIKYSLDFEETFNYYFSVWLNANMTLISSMLSFIFLFIIVLFVSLLSVVLSHFRAYLFCVILYCWLSLNNVSFKDASIISLDISALSSKFCAVSSKFRVRNWKLLRIEFWVELLMYILYLSLYWLKSSRELILTALILADLDD